MPGNGWLCLTLLYVHWHAARRTNTLQNVSEERSAGCLNTWNTLQHTRAHTSQGAYIRHKRNNSALHSESPLMVPSHEIWALARTQAQKGKTKTNHNKRTQTFTHPAAYMPAKCGFGCGSVSRSSSICSSVSASRQPLCWWLVLDGLNARRGQMLNSGPLLLHNSCFIGPIPCGVMRPIKSVPH